MVIVFTKTLFRQSLHNCTYISVKTHSINLKWERKVNISINWYLENNR